MLKFEMAKGNMQQDQQQQQQRHGQQLADEEARRWWSEREAKVEKDMSLTLHKRMETQRAQIHAFKTEQSKWEHELQLRISKYAHDRKLLSEQNIELQESLTRMEEKQSKMQIENDLQAAHILELEGQLRGAQSNSQQTRALRAENDVLMQRVTQWESLHKAEVGAAVRQQEELQNGWISGLEIKLEQLSEENARLRSAVSSQPDRISRRGRVGSGSNDAGSSFARRTSEVDGGSDAMAESSQWRLTELEKAVKHKDQSIVSLKSMLERHEFISDEKVKLIQSKYEQVKAINIALQRKLLQSLTDETPSNEHERHERS